ncbi:hypothetical protein [Okeania sp. KiyG1]|uniref:hypothetical protein n=1 Tax=Okeania sp. KiyG1 TaxID=2720165 RepID=UPI001923DC59|nr:hypothetical protein [Okeania sp. KiyG1]
MGKQGQKNQGTIFPPTSSIISCPVKQLDFGGRKAGGRRFSAIVTLILYTNNATGHDIIPISPVSYPY